MAIRDDKVRCTFTLTAIHAEWISEWLKKHGAPPVMFSFLVDDYVKGLCYTLQELEKKEGDIEIGDLFKITGEALNHIKEPPLS